MPNQTYRISVTKPDGTIEDSPPYQTNGGIVAVIQAMLITASKGALSDAMPVGSDLYIQEGEETYYQGTYNGSDILLSPPHPLNK